MTERPLLGERYRLLDRLGVGGMGEVWKAQDIRFTRRFVAIKLIKDEDSRRQNAVNRERLERSARKESSKGSLDATEAVGLLAEALRSDGGLDKIRARVESGRSGAPQLSYDTVLGIFDGLVDDPDVSDTARSRAQLLKMLRIEADSVAELHHNNIVGISDVNDREGFLAMDYIEGRTLDQLIRRGQVRNRVDQLKLMEQVCDGLAAAHRLKLVHRDIKPNNLIVDEASGTLKILDFGIVRRVVPEATATVGVIIGTPPYMSPEQIRGQSVDERSDIFSVGVVFYELLTGQLPFPFNSQDPLGFADLSRRIQQEDPRPLHELVPDIEPEIEDIVDTALAKDRDERFQSIVDMRKRLERIRVLLENENATVRRMPTGQREGRRRHQAQGEAETVGGAEAEAARVSAEKRAAEEREAAEAARARTEQIGALVGEGETLLANSQVEEAVQKAREAIALDRTNEPALALSRRANAELRRLADEAQARADEARRAEEQRLAEVARQAEEQRLAEAERVAAEARERQAEARRLEEERQVEARRLEEERQAEAERQREEAAREAEARRIAHEENEAKQAEARRVAEAERLAELERQKAARRVEAGAVATSARAAQEAGRHAEAVSLYERALALDIENDDIRDALGGARQARDRAEQEARRQESIERHLSQAESLLARDQFAKALEAVGAATREGADTTRVRALSDRIVARRAEVESQRLQRRDARLRQLKTRGPWAAGLALVLLIAAGAWLWWPRPATSGGTGTTDTGTKTTPAPTFAVSVDIHPWARVKIFRADRTTGGAAIVDTKITPFVVDLAAGTYKVECENGALTAPGTFDLTVSATGPQTFSRTMPGFDVDQAINGLFAVRK